MPRIKTTEKCSVEGCENPYSAKGLCQYHYIKRRLENKPESAKAGLRGHPFYHLWFERKQAGILCWEWSHFPYFIEGISPKPDGDYFLVRIDPNKPLGPDNFQWQLHLKRQEGESNKDWWARKRTARIIANPSMERARNYKRCYGLSLDEINEKLKNQNFKCAICKKAETAIDGRTGSIKTLALDHCHDSNKVRDLLCNRCNTTLGKAEDSVELLQEMINYLNKHKETN